MNNEHHGIDITAVITALVSLIGTVFGLLPAILSIIASTLSIIWLGIRICETRTVQKWIHSRRVSKD